LVALGPAKPDANKRTRWLVRCDCGVEKLVDGAHMRYGKIRSCGCLAEDMGPEHGRKHLARFAGHNRRHGMSRTPIYAIWKTMWDRCRNPRNRDWKYYGGLGVRVCERWALFENFYADMGEAPSGLTLDRRDPFGDYEPSNCRWITHAEQVRNTRRHANRVA